MATTKKRSKNAHPVGPVDTSNVNPEAQYHVSMRYPHKVLDRVVLKPNLKHKVKGWVLMDIPVHKIASFKAA